MYRCSLAAVLVLVAARVLAQPGEPVPLWPQDLARDAQKASGPVAAILLELSKPAGDFEKATLARVDDLLKAEDAKEGAWAAEKALRAVLRYSRSQRPPAEADDRWAAVHDALADKLLKVRRRLLQLLAKAEDPAEALHWADVWLPLYPPGNPLGEEVRALWSRQGEALLKAGKGAAARAWLDRIDATSWQSPEADPLRKGLRAAAESLLTDAKAKDLSDTKAVALLQQAQAFWPRLPGLRDELAVRNRNYQTLHVAVRDLPGFLSPALAWTDSEHQAVELIFEGLVQVHDDIKLGPRYRPALLDHLSGGTGVKRPLELRRDAYWADGERFTAADVRHTIELLTRAGQPGSSDWRDLLDRPHLEDNPFRLELVFRQGQFDPWAPLAMKVLPQHHHGKPLTRADEPDFARRPVGTGPYQLDPARHPDGQPHYEPADGRSYLVFRANPYYLRRGRPAPGPLREVRFFSWKGGDKEVGKPLPDLVLDVLPAQAAALQKLGYTDIRSLPVPRVWFLGVNHRRPPFGDVNVRRALAHAIDRQGLLARHFPADVPGGAAPVTLNGLFPRGSWATSPAARPEELFAPDKVRTSARLAAKELEGKEWTLKYPDGDPRLDVALKEAAETIMKLLAESDIRVTVRPVPLPPRKLQEAVRERDFDLVYLSLDRPDRSYALWPLFDPSPDAVKPGGSNFLGYDDAELQSWLRKALHHRDFNLARDHMQGAEAHLYATMPLIPLWKLPYVVAVHGRLHAADLDPLAVFANVLEWKVSP
jgi:ABC-type transport system substrate-binding protein